MPVDKIGMPITSVARATGGQGICEALLFRATQENTQNILDTVMAHLALIIEPDVDEFNTFSERVIKSQDLFDFVRVHTVKDADSKIKEQRYQLAVLSSRYPREADIFMSEHPDIPVLLVSDYNQPDFVNRAKSVVNHQIKELAKHIKNRLYDITAHM